MLSRALDIHADLKYPRDKEWIYTSLSLLKACVRRDAFIHEEKEFYIESLVNALTEAAGKLEEGWVSFKVEMWILTGLLKIFIILTILRCLSK